MDVILNTIFDNPRLPQVQLPGFADNFNRPEADTMGHTDDGKPWQIYRYDNSPSVWGITDRQTATMKSANNFFHMAVVDSFSSSGKLVGKIHSIDEESNRRFGLAVRVKDANNYVSVVPVSPTNPELRIQKRIDGSPENVGPSTGVTLQAGDELAVILNGPLVRVEVNGSLVIQEEVPEFTTESQHGMWAFNNAVAEWDHIEFAPH